jgi:hypothetical protein
MWPRLPHRNLEEAAVDHAAKMRRTYGLISAGDVAGLGDLVADGFVEHRAYPDSIPTRRGRSTTSEPCSRPPGPQHDRLVAAGDKA